MVMIKLGKIASAGLVLGVIAIGGGTLIRMESHQQVMANGVADAPKEDDPRADLDTIQGTWVRISTDGRKADRTCRMVVKKAIGQPKSNVPDSASAFDFEWKTDGEVGGSHNRGLLDPTGSPKMLDFIPEPEGEEGVPAIALGIYKLEGDTLTVCFMNEKSKRPTEFVAGRQGVTLDVYRRVTP